MTKVSVSVIGSFRQYYSHVILAVRDFESAGLSVRSPVVSRIVNPGDDYPRFETDSPQSSDQFIQAATLAKILSSDFVYVVAPGGYVGRTTCYELGRVQERSIPVYFSALPLDLPIEVSPQSILCADAVARLALPSCRVGSRRDERREQGSAESLAAAQKALPDIRDGVVGEEPD